MSGIWPTKLWRTYRLLNESVYVFLVVDVVLHEVATSWLRDLCCLWSLWSSCGSVGIFLCFIRPVFCRKVSLHVQQPMIRNFVPLFCYLRSWSMVCLIVKEAKNLSVSSCSLCPICLVEYSERIKWPLNSITWWFMVAILADNNINMLLKIELCQCYRPWLYWLYIWDSSVHMGQRECL